MNNTRRGLILLLGMFGVLLTFTGVTYAFFSYKGEGSKITSITTNGITFSYKEGSRNISLNEAMPMTDEEGMQQDNYFEFEIGGSSPDGFEIPYYITARKEASSSDIDEAIKVGLSELVYNDTNLYEGIKYFDELPYEECNNKVNDNNELDSSSHYECNKIYSAGDSTPDDYIMELTDHEYRTYDSLEECKHGAHRYPSSFEFVGCVQREGKYVGLSRSKDTFISVEECQNSSVYNDNMVCKKKYEEDQFVSDVYRLKKVALYPSRESCNLDSEINTCVLKYKKNEYVVDEKNLIINHYSEFDKYNKNNEHKIYKSKIPTNSNNYIKRYRLRMWIDEDTDFIQQKYNNASFLLYINVYAEGKVRPNDGPGIYDSNKKLVATWDDLVEQYGLDLEKSETVIKIQDLGTNLVLPDSITSINNFTFSQCYNLNSITVPESVVSIGRNAFLGVGVIFYSGKASDKNNWGAQALNPYIDGDFAYSDNTRSKLIRYLGSNKMIEVPSTVTSIANNAFYNKKVIIYSGNTNGTRPGYYWGAQVLNPYIDHDFAYSDNTKSTLLAYIGNSSNVIIPSGVTTIDEYAFSENADLKSVTIPASVVKINYAAFQNCTSLSEISLEENSQLASVSSNAFSNTLWYKTESTKGDVYLNGILIR